MTATIIPFPTRSSPAKASGVRAAFVCISWCVERLADGQVIDRTRVPSRTDAERIARRISLRDRNKLLPLIRDVTCSTTHLNDPNSPAA